MNNINQNQENNKNTFETWWNFEEKEQFDKNFQEFKNKYEQKLKNILPEEIVKKLSGSFELSWNLENTLNSLKNNWVSEKNIKLIYENLSENQNILKEDLDNIFNEVKNFDEKQNLNIKLWDLIWKAIKEAEKTDNDNLFRLAENARKIQQNWNSWQKADFIISLEKEMWIFNNENKKNENFTESSQNLHNNLDLSQEKKSSDLIEKESSQNLHISKIENWKENEQEKNIVQKNLDEIWATDDEWTFWIWWENKEEDIDNKANWEEINNEKNWEFLNILSNLKENWEISEVQFSKVNESFKWLSSDDVKDTFLDFIWKNITSKSRENILQKYKNNDIIDEKNFDKTNFSTDIKWKIDIDNKNLWDFEFMLAENYIYLPNKASSEDFNKEKSINTALDVTTSKILNKASPDFKKINSVLISDIKTEKNLDVKYKLLKELHKESVKEDSKLHNKKDSEKNERENIDSEKENLKKEYKKIKEEISKLQKEKDSPEKKQELENLNEKLEEIIKKAKEIDSSSKEISSNAWNIQNLSWWKNDKSSENKEKTSLN